MAGGEEFHLASRYSYLIIQCYSCGQFLIAKSGQKNKLCTYCNTRLKMRRVKVLAGTPTAGTASELVMALKEKSSTTLKQAYRSEKNGL